MRQMVSIPPSDSSSAYTDARGPPSHWAMPRLFPSRQSWPSAAGGRPSDRDDNDPDAEGVDEVFGRSRREVRARRSCNEP